MLTILQGDALEKLRELPSESVHCCICSPPFWCLRDYGTASWEGGKDGCDHAPEDRGGRFATPVSSKQASNTGSGTASRRDCKCGAKRIDSQLGLEKTPEEYVAKMVDVFREVRRVLRKDGTLWLNLGDSYASAFACDRRNVVGTGSPDENCKRPNRLNGALKEKDLCGIPWRVAFALQSDGAASPAHMRDVERMISAITCSYDTREEWPPPVRREVERLEVEYIEANRGGWYLRQDIIWNKPNPMPESVTDRCTKAHEYLFLLTKSARYFYDNEAIREQIKPDNEGWMSAPKCGPNRIYGTENQNVKQYDRICGANKRSVWTVATAPYPEAHFATYPPDLVKPCIMAGTSAKGCCAKCGAPFERIVEQTKYEPPSAGSCERFVDASRKDKNRKLSGSDYNEQASTKTLGWQPTCACRLNVEIGETIDIEYPNRPAATIPCIVLDPFAGSGTTGAVALELGRKAILIELNPKYIELIERRCNITPGLALA